MDIEITKLCYSPEELVKLKQLWAGHHQNQSFFCSWSWIQSVVSRKSENLYLAKGSYNNQLVCAALLGVNGNTAHLNKTGDEREDQAWIEYNDLLIINQPNICQEQVRSDFFNSFWRSAPLGWSQLAVDMTIQNQLMATLPYQMLSANSVGYVKKIDGHTDVDALLSSFKKSTAKQIARSFRHIEKGGLFRFVEVSNSDDLLTELDSVASLHKEQWGTTEWGSGFDNPAFVEFHQKLIVEPEARLFKLQIVETTVAYGYYFCFNNKVLFYLSAMKKHTDNKIKIGLVLHTLAMLHFAKEGFVTYDFLAGEARYKESMADIKYEMNSYSIYRPSVSGKLQYYLRVLKRKLIKMRIK